MTTTAVAELTVRQRRQHFAEGFHLDLRDQFLAREVQII